MLFDNISVDTYNNGWYMFTTFETYFRFCSTQHCTIYLFSLSELFSDSATRQNRYSQFTVSDPMVLGPSQDLKADMGLIDFFFKLNGAYVIKMLPESLFPSSTQMPVNESVFVFSIVVHFHLSFMFWVEQFQRLKGHTRPCELACFDKP